MHPSPPAILIVDDDAAHAISVRDLLAAHDYPAATITDSANVADTLRHTDYQVLILDLNMPGVTGLDVLQQIQELGVNVKAIVLSGESDLSSVTPILRLGASDYLAKPYEPQQLLTSVENALVRARLEQENQELARESEANQELHQFLLNASPDLIYMLDATGRFRYLNRKLEATFGYKVEDMQGCPWETLVGPNLVPTLERRFNERRTGTRATRSFEFDFITSAGDKRTFEFSATGLYDNRTEETTGIFTGTYGVLRDVTDARRTAHDLALSQQKFYGLFMDSPDAVFISRLSDGRLLEGNEKFRDIKARVGASDSSFDHFVFGSDHERELFERRLNASPTFLQYQLAREHDGETLYLEITARKLDIDGEPCLLATLRDRTSEHHAEMDRLLLQNQLQQASKMEAIGQLAGGIAHDFNNILASIIGYAELVQNARQRLEPNQVDRYLAEVVTAGHRARDLISQMLTFTRANRGESIRVFPLSNWTELDVWQYIHLEKIPIVPLYFSAMRPVVDRDGVLIMIDDDRMQLEPGEKPEEKMVRFRTLGCYPLTGAVESTATTLPQIIQEMLLATTSERQGRIIDYDQSASMEQKKKEGYF